MARISTYTIDSVIEGSDKLLGTDANSSSALATKNYTIDSLRPISTVVKVLPLYQI